MKSLIEGQRSLAFRVSQQVDVSLNHSDKKIKSNADEIVSLMTLQLNHFLQILEWKLQMMQFKFWRLWLYKDQGIEQLFRDNRITPIYEAQILFELLI